MPDPTNRMPAHLRPTEKSTRCPEAIVSADDMADPHVPDYWPRVGWVRLINPSPSRNSVRWLAFTGILGAVLLLSAIPALADITGPCDGSATIDGTTYDASFDTASKPIVVPADRAGMTIPYSGSITVTNTNYLGAVGVVIGPTTVNVAVWGLDENPDDKRSTDPGAIYILGSDLDNLVGLYQLTAFHDADGGSCDATAMVKLEGDPLSTPVGAAATGGAVVTGLAMAAAGIPRKKA